MHQPKNQDNRAYYEKRLADLGLSEDFPGFFRPVWRDQGRHIIPLLYPDKEGNICIPYFDLDGGPVVFNKTDNPGNPMTRDYLVKRLAKPENPKKKYDNPKGLPNQVYLTPGILDAWDEKRQIKTLYIVEGQFKALAGWRAGLDIVGITGLYGWKVGGEQGFKPVLDELIARLDPESIVLLFDADSRSLKKSHVEEGRDLAERLNTFHAAVKQFQETALPYSFKGIYFAQVHEKSPEKGLDDLLQTVLQDHEEEDKILESLAPGKLTSPKNRYFQGIDLATAKPQQVRAFFRIHAVGTFYNAYSELVGDTLFRWNRGRYQFSEESGKVEQIAHPDAQKYIRLGCDYFKRITVKTQIGEEIKVLEPWKKGEFSEDYGKGFLKQITRYDAWANVPCNDPAGYQPEFEMSDGTRLLNMYLAPPHTPTPPDNVKFAWQAFPNIWKFLKHIFGHSRLSSGYPRYVLGLDWLTVLYQKPEHKLPIIVLVSEENETGKSTFIDLLMILLGENVVRIGNDDIHDNYNAHYISKLVAGIEEGLIEKEPIKEKIKALSTSPTANFEAKFVNKSRVDCLLKFIITSNKPTGFMRLDMTDERFFVVQVPRIQKKDPDLLSKMQAEAPFFLHFLESRETKHPRINRMWFGPEVIRTPEFVRCAKDSLPSLQRAAIDLVRAYFFDHETRECCMTLKELMTALDMRGTDRAYLKKILIENMGIPEPLKNSRKKRPHTLTQESESGRWWVFEAKDFLTHAELKALEDGPTGESIPF